LDLGVCTEFALSFLQFRFYLTAKHSFRVFEPANLLKYVHANIYKAPLSDSEAIPTLVNDK